MRVRLFHTIPGEQRTSSEVYARELANGLQGLENNPVTISHWRPGSPLRTAAGRIPSLARLAGYGDRYVIYQWQARGQDGDINHIVDHGYGHLAYSLDPRRTVVTFHDPMLLKLRAGELPTTSSPRLAMLGHRLSLAAMRRVPYLITDSQSSKQDFVRLTGCSPDRIRVIPLGVSPHFRPPEGQDRPGRAEPSRQILHVGHCGAYKNIEGILRALPLIEKGLGGVVFTKVGGPFTRTQQALIEMLKLEGQVQHLGAVPLHDLPRVYADADVLLMPSLYEGFGLPALEAMACGTPVVASNQGSLPEVVGDAGLLVEPTDVNRIADVVTRVLRDPQLRQELRRRGLERARRFTWEGTAGATLAVYRQILEETR